MPNILIFSPCHSTNPLQVVIEYAANRHFFLLAHTGIFTISVYVVTEVAAYMHFFLLAHSCSLLTHVHVHTYFSLSCFLSLVFSCPPVFFVSCFLCRVCRVFSPSPVFFCESPQEVPSAEAFTKNLKLPRRRAARMHTTGCSTATIKCDYFTYHSISQRISPKRSRNSLRQLKSTRQTFANRVPLLGATWTACRSSPK
jgi:hypothetical protein